MKNYNKGDKMQELDCSKIYSLREIETVRPNGYLIIKKNFENSQKKGSYDRYRIVDIMEDVTLIKYSEKDDNFNRCNHKGIIFIEMVIPES